MLLYDRNCNPCGLIGKKPPPKRATAGGELGGNGDGAPSPGGSALTGSGEGDVMRRSTRIKKLKTDSPVAASASPVAAPAGYGIGRNQLEDARDPPPPSLPPPVLMSSYSYTGHTMFSPEYGGYPGAMGGFGPPNGHLGMMVMPGYGGPQGPFGFHGSFQPQGPFMPYGPPPALGSSPGTAPAHADHHGDSTGDRPPPGPPGPGYPPPHPYMHPSVYMHQGPDGGLTGFPGGPGGPGTFGPPFPAPWPQPFGTGGPPSLHAGPPGPPTSQ